MDLFKKSIDKVFDRVSAFTWEKYKEENDDESDDEENYREFEEIKKQADLNNSGLQKDLQEWKSKTTPIGKNVIEFREIKAMILGCRGFYRRCMEDRRAELNPKAFNRCKEQVDECNDLLQLDYSSKNLKQLKQFKNDVYNRTYQEDLQKKMEEIKKIATHKDRMLVPKNLLILIRAILNLLL